MAYENYIPFTDDMHAEFLQKMEDKGVGYIELCNYIQNPSGISPAKIDNWKRRLVKSIDPDEWKAVINALDAIKVDFVRGLSDKRSRRIRSIFENNRGMTDALLCRPVSDRPQGFRPYHINEWLDGSRVKIPRDHLAYVLRQGRNLHKIDIVPITPERLERLRQLKAKCGVSFRSLLTHNPDAPDDLLYTKFDKILAGTSKTVRRDHLAFVINYMRNFDSEEHKKRQKERQEENQKNRPKGVKRITAKDIERLQKLSEQTGLGGMRIANLADTNIISFHQINRILRGHIPRKALPRDELARIFNFLRNPGGMARVELNHGKRTARLGCIKKHAGRISAVELCKKMPNPRKDLKPSNITNILRAEIKRVRRTDLANIFWAARKCGVVMSGPERPRENEIAPAVSQLTL